MIATLIALALLLPFLTALLIALERQERFGPWLLPWAALPALLVGVMAGPEVRLDVPWLLLGTSFGLEAVQRTILLFTALLWGLAAVFAQGYHAEDPHRRRFFVFFLLTMGGNLGLILAQDVIGFYLFFAVMNFAAFGLIVHTASAEARYAAGVYLVLVIIGEALILPALWTLAAAADSLELAALAEAAGAADTPGWVIGGIIFGFGIKAGLIPLHVWLPLAHPVAPTPASAVLSGTMIKAGLLAWLSLLPIGVQPLEGWGLLLMGLGIVAAFYGVVAGLAQDKAKTLLAYSSISQMGLITIAVGVGLTNPFMATAAFTAATVYAFHHGLAKGALFLGVGIVEHCAHRRQQIVALVLLALPAAALAGLPLTSGIVAKTALKEAVAVGPPDWAAALDVLLPLAALGTALLMLRFFAIMAKTLRAGDGGDLWAPWLTLLFSVAILLWLPPISSPQLVLKAFESDALWVGTWPVLLALAIAAAVWFQGHRLPWLTAIRIPAGDLLALVLRLQPVALAAWHEATQERPGLETHLEKRLPSRRDLSSRLVRAETWLSRWPIAGLAFLLVVAALVVLAV